MLKSSRSPITVGIVGLGRAGWHLHLEPISKLSGFKIVAVADPLPERCTEASERVRCETFSSIDELLDRSTADLVVVATPSATHYQDALKVLKSGRHCVAEKPLALQSEEADELVFIAQANGLGLFVNHSCLHSAEYNHLKEILESRVLGEIFTFRTCWNDYVRRSDWQTLKKNGGGQLNNKCPHVLSVVLPLLGSPVKRVFADLRNIKDAGDAEDHVHVVLQTESGVTADIVASSAFALSAPRWNICGNRGSLLSDGKISRIRYYDGSGIPSLEVSDAAAPRESEREVLPWQERELHVDSAKTSSFYQNVLVVLNGVGEQVVTAHSAAEVVRVTNLIQRAAGV